ncbi:MAG: type II toxin-antitoxin system HicB family antitoxin [Candidatus Colwellbacteria bacterium]|nr:type II toxin-antitoxin system HicB family antitoxin [Candidatus Colwellbacteria bacterium]
MRNFPFTTQIFKEGEMYVAYCKELDVSSCGNSIDEARKNIKDALLGFLKSANDRGVLEEILEEAGYKLDNQQWRAPELLLLEKSFVSMQHA